MSESGDSIDWSVTTWEGSRREQLRRWRRLSVRQRLEALDELTDLAEMSNETPGTDRNPGATTNRS